MSPHRQQYRTRRAPRRVEPESHAPRFTGPPGLQPKVQRKQNKELPQWQPQGHKQSNILEKLGKAATVQAKLEVGHNLIAHELTQNLSRTEASAPSVQRKDYEGETEGIEVENPSGHQLVLKRNKDRGVIAEVITKEDEEVIADLTTDMGSNPYTIENRTRPVMSQDQDGISQRKDALALMKRQIESAGEGSTLRTGKTDIEKYTKSTGTSVQPAETDALKLQIKQRLHKVVPKGRQSKPGVQITKGLNMEGLIAQAEERVGVFDQYKGAKWMDTYSAYKEYYLQEVKKEEHAESAPIFAMLASFLHYFMRRVDFGINFYGLKAILSVEEGEQGLGRKGVRKGELIFPPSFVSPAEKNSWGVLPKTPPGNWLSELPSKVKLEVTTALRGLPNVNVCGALNPTAWSWAYSEYILAKRAVGGHEVPAFKIAGRKGHAFEHRTASQEDRQRYEVDEQE
ncbi:MAG TPA: hypothetical protein DD761_00845 [Cyanobacteria bacterium UBA11691]|nr:hypothetical protein [Cyanobacteria bacterium UBA11691]